MPQKKLKYQLALYVDPKPCKGLDCILSLGHRPVGSRVLYTTRIVTGKAKPCAFHLEAVLEELTKQIDKDLSQCQ